MKNLLSYSGFVNEHFPKKDTEEVKEEIVFSKKEIPHNLDKLEEVNLLTENALSPEEIKENIGLMQKKKLKEKFNLLYDFQSSKILGYAHLQKIGNESHYELQKIVAEKNYGPLVSDFALMSVFPEGVSPTSTSSSGELKVWYYYLTLREDVKKKLIPKDDRKVTIKSDYITAGLSEEEALEIINTQFFLEPTPEFQTIVKRGEEKKERDLLLGEAKNYLRKTEKNG